jgi:hypothetical protein
MLNCEWMIEKGGIPYFEKLAIERSNLLYGASEASAKKGPFGEAPFCGGSGP